MLEASKYLKIVRKRGRERKGLERVHRLIRKKEILLLAYINLSPNKGAHTPGINKDDVIDGMSQKKINTLSENLRTGRFKWRPVKRIYIPKKDGKKRQLGLPCWSEKLVQESMRMILEEYYEPMFSSRSHGFRRNKGCHTAIKQIAEKEWIGTKWFIEGDIKGCFDNIDHEKLLEILSRDIKDSRFMKLLKNMLETGYMENWEYNINYSGIPQGGVLSPLLSNIYMNELDKFIEKKLIPKYTRGKCRKPNKEYRKLQFKLRVARRNGKKEEAKSILKEKRKLPSFDTKDTGFRRLRYIRYADDWLIGFIGSKEEAVKIKEDIADFLKKELKVELAMDKTLITSATQEKARFLNYEINTEIANHKLVKVRGKKKRTLNGHIQVRMPKTVLKKWIKRYTRKNKPSHRSELINLSDFDIVMKYNLELRGLYNYYSLAVNVHKLHELKFYMKSSLVKTLAKKHKCRGTKIYRKYINNKTKALEVKVPRENKKSLTASFGNFRIVRKKNYNLNYQEDKYMTVHFGRSELLERLLADRCELCNTEDNIQIHHIKKISDLKRRYEGKKDIPEWKKQMIAINRNTLVVCRDCHNLIHYGKYDGRKLTKV
jgi:group II intron reverse transcriptase/maturase